MPIQPQQPASPQANPYVPPGPEPLLMEKFMGMNTATLRPGVPDEQCYWIDGFFPLAPRNLRTLYGIGSSIYTAGGGKTVVAFYFFNIGAVPYSVIFLSDGSVDVYNINTTAVTTILAAATITSPSILNQGISQWGQQYLIIVSNQTNGYWLWDGNAVFKSGTLAPNASITAAGSGYVAPVTVVLTGGHGTGASVSASISAGALVSVSIVNPGSGYQLGDTVVAGLAPASTGGTGASVVAFISGSTLSSLSIVNGGSGYGAQASLVFTGGAGTGQGPVQASAFPIVTAGTITGTSITSRGFNYASAPTVTVTDVAQTASIIFQLMPFGVQGTAVETYTGRVWVAKGPTVNFTAPGSFQDFSTSNGGGNFTSGDSFLRVGYIQLLQTNGFLYLIGDSSVNYISGVQTSGSPPTTSFTNQNADPQVGTPYPAAVETAGQDLLFANSFGVHTLYGARAVKISEPLDGVYNTVSNFGGLQLSASQAVIFGRKVWMVLSKIVDPVSGSTVNKLFMWNGKLWWAASQDVTLTFIRHQEINSVITAYGTDGTSIYPLFNTASTAIQKIVQSRYWDAPGGYQFNHLSTRIWAMAYYYSTSTPNLQVGIDGVFINPSTLVTAESTQNYTITGPASTGFWVIPPYAVGQQGVLTGMTLKTNAADMALISAMLNDEVGAYRG